MLKYSLAFPGQRFGQHIDESVEDEHGRVSEFTALLYLNDSASSDLSGGETVFYNSKGQQAVSFAPVQGSALLHGHGQRCLTHEGAVVRNGTKYLMRTDVLYR